MGMYIKFLKFFFVYFLKTEKFLNKFEITFFFNNQVYFNKIYYCKLYHYII